MLMDFPFRGFKWKTLELPSWRFVAVELQLRFLRREKPLHSLRIEQMAEWLFRVGLVVAGVGALLLSPLSDLLPVDLWLFAKGLFQPNGTHLYLTVVPSTSSNVFECSLVVVGITLTLVGRFLRKSE